MKIDIDVSKFRNALDFVNGIDGKSTLPILNNVLIKAEGNRINLTTTNLVIGKSIELESEQEGLELVTTIPLKKVVNIFRSIDAEYCVLRDKGEQIEIVAGKSRFKLNTLPANEYPSIVINGEEKRFNFPSTELKRILMTVQHAMGKNDVRLFLNGVYLDGKDGLLRAVATDGHRMAVAETECDWVGNIILPRFGVLELIKALTDVNEIAIVVTESHAKFLIGNKQITLTLLDGSYPNYQRIIPAASKYHVTSAIADLHNAINRVAIMAHPNTNGIQFTISREKLIVESGAFNGEEASEDISAESDCDQLVIGLNSHYLIDVLNKLELRDCVIELEDCDRSIVIKDRSNTFIVMPMRI